jgi:hypothetical protein
MPNGPDPADPNRIVPVAAARTLFEAIADDQSLSRPGSPAVGSSTASVPPWEVARIVVRVESGSGLTGRASEIAGELIADGFSRSTSYGSTVRNERTTIRFAPTGTGRRR